MDLYNNTLIIYDSIRKGITSAEKGRIRRSEARHRKCRGIIQRESNFLKVEGGGGEWIIKIQSVVLCS